MRVAVLGKSGQLARCLVDTAPAEVRLVCLGRDELDLSALEPQLARLDEFQPHLILNAAAYTAVDNAEHDRSAAFRLNAGAPQTIGRFCAERCVPLIHVSTDYVFDGTAERPYRETDLPAPINVYGESKLEGERLISGVLQEYIIIRTSWLYSSYGQNFVKTMLKLAGEREQLRVVADQYASPTSAHALAQTIWSVAQNLQDSDKRAVNWGVYHYADSGTASWAEFAEEIFSASAIWLKQIPNIEYIATSDYPTPARRPRYTVLDTANIAHEFGICPRPWQVSLEDVVKQLFEGASA